MALSRGERMAFWVQEFERCVKCYACRQVCPMCYCERCMVDKNQPISIDPAPSTKGNFAWHIARAFHLAGRCIGCGACARGLSGGDRPRTAEYAVGQSRPKALRLPGGG